MYSKASGSHPGLQTAKPAQSSSLAGKEEEQEGRFQAKRHLGSEKPAVKRAAPDSARSKPPAVGLPPPLRSKDPQRHQLSSLSSGVTCGLFSSDAGTECHLGDLCPRGRVGGWPHRRRPVLLACDGRQARGQKSTSVLSSVAELRPHLSPPAHRHRLPQETRAKPLLPRLQGEAQCRGSGSRTPSSGPAASSGPLCLSFLICELRGYS